MKTKADLLKTMGTLNACTEAAEGWCRGEVPLEEVRAAAAAYYAAYAATAAYADAAHYATHAAYYAADAAANAAVAAHYAAHTATHNAHAAVAARTKSLARSAELVRSVIAAEAFV